jgi:NarL family two-component system response regulator LiaR
MTIRILLVDDHKVVRQGLQMFLGMDEDLEIVGEAADGQEAIDRARELKPDVVLMDLLMPEVSGIQAIATIRQTMPDVEVIALTSVLEDRAIYDAMRAGAIGYLLKDTEPDELSAAIRAAAAGQVQLSPRVAARLMQEVHPPDNPETLTDRETEVIRLLAQGLSNKGIGEALVIGEKTVKTHVSSILAKLGVPSRTQAALYAIRQGIAPGPGSDGEL